MDPLACYQPEPTGEVEVDVMPLEVDFVPPEDIFPPALPDQEMEAGCSHSPRKRRVQRLPSDSPEVPRLTVRSMETSMETGHRSSRASVLIKGNGVCASPRVIFNYSTTALHVLET